MKERKTFILKTLRLLSIIIMYYIIGKKSIFLYVLSISLYNIFSSCFDHISIKDNLKKLKTPKSKLKLLKIVLLFITILSTVFLLLSILISDLLSIFLNLNNITLIFIFEGLTIVTKPLIKLLSEYLDNIKNNHNYLKLLNIYNILDYILLLIISLFSFRIFNIKTNIAISLLYLSKIISTIIVLIIIYLIAKPLNKLKTYKEDRINYTKELKQILTNNSYKSIVSIVKNSYYYISIIVLYLVLNTRYNYKLAELENIISFMYFYALEIVNYLIFLAKSITKTLPNENKIIDKLYQTFKMTLTITIIIGIISPLTCKVIFNNPSMSIYLLVMNILAIFILLYDMTYENIKNKTVINISLIAGIILKIILVIPLINSYYRMGYNLVYGDIVSTIIAMFISTIINYIYLRKIDKTQTKYFEKILDILYENILLCIILILVQFIVPIDSSNYLKSFGLIIIYLFIAITYLKIKNKKRG